MNIRKNLFWVIFVAGVVAQGCAPAKIYSCEVRKSYYPDGGLKSVWCYKNEKLNGIKREYREDGTILTVTQYKNNRLHGSNNTYYPDGAIWTKEVYKNGSIIMRLEYDQEGNVVSKDKFF